MGARLAVVEAARNLACVGAEPRALVNCLNFGNPEHEEVMWQFAEVTEGMSEACEVLYIPVVGGNVSFYNESRGRDIDPTPVVGLVGVIDELDAVPATARAPGRIAHRRARCHECRAGRLGIRHARTGCVMACRPPSISTQRPRSTTWCVSLVRERVVDGVHDCSDGGLADRARRDGDRRQLRRAGVASYRSAARRRVVLGKRVARGALRDRRTGRRGTRPGGRCRGARGRRRRRRRRAPGVWRFRRCARRRRGCVAERDPTRTRA